MANADAQFTVDGSGAEKVEALANRAEKAMTKTKGATNKAGMAVLDFSRGFEDFAVSGMRGAMNNIPGLLMNLGVGMGLTGVISVATVTIYKAVEALEAYMDAMHEANMLRQENAGVKFIDIKAMEDAFNPEAVKRAKEMQDVMGGLADAISLVQHVTSLKENENTLGREVVNIREIIELTKNGATEEGKRGAVLFQNLETEEKIAQAAVNAVNARKESVAQLKAMRTGQENILANATNGDIDFINKKMKEAYMDTYKQEMSKGTSSFISAERASKRAQSVGKLRKESMFGSEGAFDVAFKEREIAKEKLEIINKQLEAEEKLLNKEEASAASAEKVKQLKKEQLFLTEELTQLEERQEKEKKDREAAMKSMMAERVVDVGSMMSSQARTGLSGNESQSALGTLNIAKQQLSVLKQIVRNTRKNSNTYN